MIKKQVKTIVDVSLTGATLPMIGSAFPSNLKGIGDATQAIVAAGTAKRSAERFFKNGKSKKFNL